MTKKRREHVSGSLATFGAGCFWGVEDAFRQVDGVTDVSAGYAGGTVESPTYQQVCTGRTGHAEVVQIEYDSGRVTYDELLDRLWSVHDPTTLDRQGPDVGSQYRSVIFSHSEEQEAAARASIDRAESSGRFANPIVTQVETAPQFYRAEEYHQRYFEKHSIGAR